MSKRSIEYHLRFHDSTKRVPEYLLSDLLVGRRSTPALAFESWEEPAVGRRYSDNYMVITFPVSLANEGLVSARNIDCGIIYWGIGCSRLDRQNRKDVPATGNLRSYIRAIPPTCDSPPDAAEPLEMMRAFFRRDGVRIDLEPFERKRPGIQHLVLPDGISAEMNCALYAVASDHPPEWHQLSLVIRHGRVQSLEVQPAPADGPRVSCAFRSSMNQGPQTQWPYSPPQSQRTEVVPTLVRQGST